MIDESELLALKNRAYERPINKEMAIEIIEGKRQTASETDYYSVSDDNFQICFTLEEIREGGRLFKHLSVTSFKEEVPRYDYVERLMKPLGFRGSIKKSKGCTIWIEKNPDNDYTAVNVVEELLDR